MKHKLILAIAMVGLFILAVMFVVGQSRQSGSQQVVSEQLFSEPNRFAKLILQEDSDLSPGAYENALVHSEDSKAVPPAREVHYNGYLKLKVSNPEKSVQQLAELIAEYGGFVEQLTGTSATLRVPVASFREVMTKVANYGEVMTSSMTAQDVSDSYLAVELRNKTLKASRNRLLALLSASRDAAEKLRLLQEIKRLNQDIDQLDLQLTTLASLANFSRLSVEFKARNAEMYDVNKEPIALFRWIHQLSPFRRDVASSGARLWLDVPKGFVALTDQQHWIAESADGAVIWTSVLHNQPHGNTGFWLDAITQRLSPDYASAEESNIGDFKVLRLVDPSEQAYRYQIAVRVHGEQLLLVEIYYPSAEQEARYSTAIAAALQGGQS